MRGLFWAFILLLVLWSCNRKRASMDRFAEKIDTIAASDTMLTVDSTLLMDTIPRIVTAPHLLLKFERTACYGHCPAFIFTVYTNGDATYEGKRHVERTGIYLANLSPAQLDSLQSQARRARLLQLSDTYPENGQPISDLPNAITQYIQGNSAKTIVHNHAAPKPLLAFEEYLEALIVELRWLPKVE